MIRAAILLALLQLISSNNLPEDWTKCHRSDPNFNACLKTAVQDAINKLSQNGIPSLGLKTIDPLDVDVIEVQQKEKSSAVSLKITLEKAQLHGISKTSMTKFDAHLDNYGLNCESVTPLVTVEADYVMDGQILVLPVTGKGKCNLTFSDMRTLHDMRGKKVERDGEVYMELEKYIISLTPNKMNSYFYNLFNGDKILGETVNQVINENSLLIYNELKPSLEKALGNVFLNYANTIFKNVPVDNIFLP